MKTAHLTALQQETLRLISNRKVSENNHGHGAWRIVGASSSVVGRLNAMGLVRREGGKSIGGVFELTEAGFKALHPSAN